MRVPAICCRCTVGSWVQPRLAAPRHVAAPAGAVGIATAQRGLIARLPQGHCPNLLVGPLRRWATDACVELKRKCSGVTLSVSGGGYTDFPS